MDLKGGRRPGFAARARPKRERSQRGKTGRGTRPGSRRAVEGPGRHWGTVARAAPGEQGKAADRRQGGALSREANTVMRSPTPAPGGTGLAGRLALSARSSDGTASAFARFLAMHPGQPRRGHAPMASRPQNGGAGLLTAPEAPSRHRDQSSRPDQSIQERGLCPPPCVLLPSVAPLTSLRIRLASARAKPVARPLSL